MRFVRPQRIEPGPGQESVWDYPRPPAIEPTPRLLRVALDGVALAETTHAIRVLETSQPPAYYIPPDDVAMEHLEATGRHTHCEWKGRASYFTVTVGDTVVPDVAWTYHRPVRHYAALTDHVAFYPQRLDCSVDGEAVVANEGAFYGGWITTDIVGPFKGGAGSAGW